MDTSVTIIRARSESESTRGNGTASDLAATAPDTAAGARSCAASGGGGTRENADESGPLGDAGSLSQFAVTFSS